MHDNVFIIHVTCKHLNTIREIMMKIKEFFSYKYAFNLFTLYVITFLMRASFYVSIATVGSPRYSGELSETELGFILALYPVAELISVSFFGALTDKIGRKPVLMFSLVTMLSAAFLFSILPIHFLVIASIVFGIGAASNVASSLAMVAEMSSVELRARLMSFYDLATIGGLVIGYGSAIILLRFIEPINVFHVAIAIVGIAILLGVFLKETHTGEKISLGITAMIKEVASDKNIQSLIPVYVPIISLYGMFLVFTEKILEEHFSGLETLELILLFSLMGIPLVLSMIISGYYSDKWKKRKPFIIVGLIGLGTLVVLIISHATNLDALWNWWPVLVVMGFATGAFPPAALAYISDVSKKETRGTTMGVYSLIFGMGMIIGPISGGYTLEHWGLFGLVMLVIIYIAIAITGTLFMRELVESAENASESAES